MRTALKECSPKWKLAADVLAEIKEDHAKRTKGAGGQLRDRLTESCSITGNRVLFLVKDSLALAQLRDVLVSGTASVSDQRYRWFISQQAAEIRSRAYKQHAQQQAKRAGGVKRAAPGAGPGDGGNIKYARADQGSSSSSSGSSSNAQGGGDNRTAFLHPSDSDLLGLPVEPAAAALQGLQLHLLYIL